MRMNHYRLNSLRFALLSFVAVVALSFGAPLSVHALTISPSRIELVGDAGTTVTREVLLVNETEETETYYPSFSNFEAQGDDGSPSFVSPKEGLGTWMQAGGPLTLRAGESREIQITITIPQGTPPGGNFAAVFWGTTPPSQTGAVSVGSRIGVLVLLSVSGEIKESFGLVDFQTKEKKWFYKSLPVGFEYRFSNQGGDRIKPVASITVRSLFGWRVKKLDANPFEGNVLPNTTRKFIPEWTRRDTIEAVAAARTERSGYSFVQSVKDEWHNFAFGVFRAKLSVEFGTEEHRTTSKAVYFVIFPWELLVILIPGVYILFIILRFLLRRYNRSVIRRARAQLADKKNV